MVWSILGDVKILLPQPNKYLQGLSSIRYSYNMRKVAWADGP